MDRATQPSNAFADAENCCERCLSSCHTTKDHASESLEDPFADPSHGLQRMDSALEFNNTSIKENERRILARFATSQPTDADCDYVLKTLQQSAYQAGYAKGKRHSCIRDYAEGYSDGFNSAKNDCQQDQIDRAFKRGRDYDFGPDVYNRLPRRSAETSFERLRGDRKLDKVMGKEGFVKQPHGGWIMAEANTSLREDWKQEWTRFKGLFKSRKSNSGRGKDEWRKLMDLDDVDEAAPKSKQMEKFGARLRRVKGRNDVSTNF